MYQKKSNIDRFISLESDTVVQTRHVNVHVCLPSLD